jgi:hypothetical protein
MKWRPLIFWALAFAFAATTVWWALYVPRDSRAPLRAIPAGATWVGAHYRLAERWDSMSENPLLASMAGALGVDEEDWEETLASPDTRKFLDTFARDELALAYVPKMRATGRPAWVFAAWLGGRSQRLRWTLKSIKDPTLRPASARNGWRVWVWTPKKMKNGERITFALVEGMVVGCIATDTLGIEDVLACVDGHMTSLAMLPALSVPPAREGADRGWVRVPAEGGWGPPIRYTLEFLDGGRLRGTVTAPGNPVGLRPAPAAHSLDEFSALLGDRPAAALVVDRALAQWWIARAFTNPVGREVAALLRMDGPGAAGFALVGGPYSGRFRAVRLPSVLAGFSAEDPAGVVRGISGAFDRLNAATGWGLIPQPISVGTQRVYAIEATGRSMYAQADVKERIAYVPLERSVVFASNLEALTKIVREAQSGEGPSGRRLDEGMRRMRDRHALAYLWMDLDDGAKLLRLAITAWSLKLLVENPRESLPMRQRLNEAKAWIDALAPQRLLQIWARPRQDSLEYEFMLGEES